jgi:LacI family transcriptional regulator, galactose operon repressor
MMRRVAFLDCMNEIGLSTSSDLLVEGDHTMEVDMRAMSILAALPNRPYAVICSNDLTAIGLMRQAFELSLEVPRDLSVVGFDIRLAHFMIPPLTTVQMSQTEIAEAAFSALLQAREVQTALPAPEVGTIRTNLVLRRSTALFTHRRRNPSCRYFRGACRDIAQN